MLEMYLFITFYIILSSYTLVATIIGAKFIKYIEEGDKGILPNISRFISLPFSICIFASLILDELIKIGKNDGISISPNYTYVDSFIYCFQSIINTLFFGIFNSFGIQFTNNIQVVESFSFASLLMFSFETITSISFLALAILLFDIYYVSNKGGSRHLKKL